MFKTNKATSQKKFAQRSIMEKVRKIMWRKVPPTNSKSSITATVKKIQRYATNSSSVNTIGIHGVGGIGKTTAIKALIDSPVTKNTFDAVVFLTASKSWTVTNFQDEISRQLSISCGGFENEGEMAAKLLETLSNMKFLLVLDDFSGHVDFDAIGIPRKNHKSGSKIVLATREVEVLCAMDIDKVIKVGFLSFEEASTLFREQVGDVIESHSIRPIAEGIVKECGGLPFLLVVIGRAMRRVNNAIIWMFALRQLESANGHQNRDHEGRVIRMLTFSYDRLKALEAKNCFLYSALHEEHREISISEFIERCLKEGLIHGPLGDARKRGCDIVETLVDAFLLEKTDDGLGLKMHDLVRDLAFFIISRKPEDCWFLGKCGANVKGPRNEDLILARASARLKEPPLNEDWGKSEKVFLMDNVFLGLPERPNCQNLVMLFLQGNKNLTNIPNSFFESTPFLQVLDLSETKINSLPSSLMECRSLKELIIRDCPFLGDIPREIGKLKLLEVLDLLGTEISKLPNEVGKLTFLKHLKVSFFSPIDCGEYMDLDTELVPSETLMNLVALKELGIGVRFGDPRWNKTVELVLEEVAELKDLTNLHFHFPHVGLLHFFTQMSSPWISNTLNKFKFSVGGDKLTRVVSQLLSNLEFDYDHEDRCLRYMGSDITTDMVTKVLNHATAFYLDHQFTICSLAEFGIDNIKDLKLCIVNECPNFRTIIDSEYETESVLPSLQRLALHSLWNLTSIWQNRLPSGSFNELKILSVHNCPKLNYTFTTSMLCYLYNLEELLVEECAAMKEIIKSDSEADLNEEVAVFSLSKLKKLTLRHLPDLVRTGSESWPSIEEISVYSCPRLINISDFRSANFIKEIKAEKKWWDGLYWEENDFFSKLDPHFTPFEQPISDF